MFLFFSFLISRFEGFRALYHDHSTTKLSGDKLIVGFLYGAGAETLVLVTGALREVCDCPGQQNQKTGVYTQKTKKNRGLGVWR